MASSSVAQQHHLLFERSQKIMREILRRDIYEIGDVGTLTMEVVVPEPDPLSSIQYPCIYWMRHLNASYSEANAPDDGENTFLKDCGLIRGFLAEWFLPYLEALSLYHAIFEGIAIVTELDKFMVSPSNVACHQYAQR
jgi:hypothetical protein